MSEKPTKVIIIGAGIGGTATAARLAHAGLDVEVYEKNSFSGGRCSLIHHEGYRFDQGPSLFLLPPIFRQLYTDLGTTLEDHIDLIQCHPNYVIHYHDGESLTLSSDRAALAREIERFEGKEGVAALEGFLKEAGIHGDQSYNLVLNKHFPSYFSLLRPKLLRNLWALHPFGSLYGRCARYFTTERLRRAFSFGSMYLGSSPFDSPGTYSLLQWTETCEGIWYPKGGFHKVVQSIIDISTSLPHPVQFNFNSEVDRVIYDTQGRAKGIRLADGTENLADVVVVNADLVWAHNNLFKKDGQRAEDGQGELLNPRMAKRLTDKPHSCSSISFYWAMDSKIPQLNAHNIFLAEDYKGSFDDIFKAHSMPRDPSFYVNVPSRVDPSASPEGKDSIVVLVPVGHLHGDVMKTSSGEPTQNWDELVERARGQVITTLESRLGITGLREKITWEGINTPLTWKDKFNLTHGSILGITHDFFNVLSFRPQARHPTVPSAYFVGASAHPGTGVPIAIAGSRLCTEAILSDLHIPLPETYGPIERKVTSDLDIKQPRALLHRAEDVIGVLLPYALGALVALISVALWTITTGRPLSFDSTIFGYNTTTQLEPTTISDEIVKGNWRYALDKAGVYVPYLKSIPIEVIPWFFLAGIVFGVPTLARVLF